MNVRTLPARRALAGLSLLAVGMIGGGALAAGGTASAADSTTSSSTSSAASTSSTAAGTTRSTDKPAETALTGDVLAEVKAAVSATYPGATFTRVETDSGGVYEAHITTAAGERLTVAVDKAYAITGTDAY